jgi:hypothetical protein
MDQPVCFAYFRSTRQLQFLRYSNGIVRTYLPGKVDRRLLPDRTPVLATEDEFRRFVAGEMPKTEYQMECCLVPVSVVRAVTGMPHAEFARPVA